LDFVHPDHHVAVQERISQMIEHELTVPLREEKYVRLDGSVVDVEVTATPFTVAGRRAVQVLFQDITERKRAEVEREHLIAELESKNAELERFTYTASHDLKSPLVTIRGFLGFLEKDIASSDFDQSKADIARIRNATDRMQRLLNELLELSRIGRLMNPPEAMPFAAIVHEAIDLVQGRIAARAVQIDVQPDLPVVQGDRMRLVEIIQNLLDNACKFMGDQAAPQITIGCSGTDQDGKPILFVRDNGSGIDPKYHEKVFGLFDKLDPQSEGTGIGLALVKRIVEVHGGHIWLESAGAQAGTTFYFTLPSRSIT
ncbi:MAG TPA: ATP-binding protein, partial [Anaerolineae bacterium]|nr:ATP-binding protein [Anaerolineae bacterium]